MKKKITCILFIIMALILALIIGVIITWNEPNNLNYTYSPEAAVSYSYKYIEERNPKFANFENNCVNYVSQCLLAGGLKMNGEPKKTLNKNKVIYSVDEWFSYRYDTDPTKPYSYYVSSAFSHNYFFIRYWRDLEKIPYGKVANTEEEREKLKDKVKVGDIIILHSDISHAAIIVKIDDKDIYYNSNTKDRDTYPLSLVDEEKYAEISYFNFVK